MREWKLKTSDFFCLGLAWDARLGGGNFANDHIWELALSGGDPPSLALQTTFGLRARAMRVFPRFVERDLSIIDPADFISPPVVTKLFPNLIQLNFSPFSGIDVKASLWVPRPHALAVIYEITNHDGHPREIRIETIGQLTPTEGQRMAPLEIEHTRVLAGQTGGLSPLIYIIGGAESGSGSYPTLIREFNLITEQPATFSWVLTAEATSQESLELARQVSRLNWEAEWSYLELLNTSMLEVFTGDPDWDAAFMLSQRQALFNLQPATGRLPHASFVINRLPDQGHSMRGDGTDYNHLWNGQSPLETNYLAGFLLPGEADIAAGLLRNFLATQEEDGFIDWRPGLAGQRSEVLATPILASLAWLIYQYSQDRNFIQEVFPGLTRFVLSWFTSQHDRDQDGRPEWDHPMQFGAEDHPAYSRWHPWSEGVDISTIENPGLLALLYRECISLVQMAELTGDSAAAADFEAMGCQLEQALDPTWDARQAVYRDTDRDTHLSKAGQLLGEQAGSGVLKIRRKTKHPVRLQIEIRSAEETMRRPRLVIHGQDMHGEIIRDEVPDYDFRWHLGRGLLTGSRIYQAVLAIEVQGLAPDDRLLVYSTGQRSIDRSGLLPLWAGLPSTPRATKMVEKAITDPAMFWRRFGLSACLSGPPEALSCQWVDPIWNTLIGEGLVRYGFRNQAAELVTRIMQAVIANLKRSKGFRRYYHAESGEGVGEVNALGGLAPLGLFLDVLGVRLLSPMRVQISGFNPFPWPVTVKYRGLTVLRLKEVTNVIFPDGQAIAIDDPAPQIISLEISSYQSVTGGS